MLSPRHITDEQIVRRIGEGDEKVLLVLYKRNIEPVRSLVMQHSGQMADAEDVLQEALIAVWQKAAQPDFSLSAKLDTLVYAIARNIWFKQLRKQGRITSTSFENNEWSLREDDDTTAAEESDRAAVLARYMDMLGHTCRELLSLFYFEQWDMEKIARKMNFANADTAKAKKYQCKKKLEEIIRQHYQKGDLF